MNYRDTEKLVVDAVRQFYAGNVHSLFKLMHPDIIFLSIGKDELMVGRDQVAQIFHNAPGKDVTYDVETISCQSHPITRASCYTLLDSTIVAYYPNDAVERVNQRATVIWRHIRGDHAIKQEGVDKAGWYTLHIHMSLSQTIRRPWEEVSTNSGNLLDEMLEQAHNATRISLRDVTETVHYIQKWQIVRVAAANHQSIVYLKNGDSIRTTNKLNLLEKELGSEFVRVHRSHLVNARYVRQMKNFSLTLENGETLPIPREKFSSIKELVRQAVTMDIPKEG